MNLGFSVCLGIMVKSAIIIAEFIVFEVTLESLTVRIHRHRKNDKWSEKLMMSAAMIVSPFVWNLFPANPPNSTDNNVVIPNKPNPR